MGSTVIDRLFTRLGAEFGNKFYSAIPTAGAEAATKAIWAERLAGLSLDEVRRGVDNLADYAKRSGGWPPGATEFRTLCRPHREPYERVEFQRRALPQKPASREFASQQLAKLRGQIGGDA